MTEDGTKVRRSIEVLRHLEQLIGRGKDFEMMVDASVDLDSLNVGGQPARGIIYFEEVSGGRYRVHYFVESVKKPI